MLIRHYIQTQIYGPVRRHCALNSDTQKPVLRYLLNLIFLTSISTITLATTYTVYLHIYSIVLIQSTTFGRGNEPLAYTHSVNFYFCTISQKMLHLQKLYFKRLMK